MLTYQVQYWGNGTWNQIVDASLTPYEFMHKTNGIGFITLYKAWCAIPASRYQLIDSTGTVHFVE